MKRLLKAAAAAALLSLVATASAFAEDMVITNARLLDGAGKQVERGFVVVKGGRIAATGPGAPDGAATKGLKHFDAHGRTVLPAYIDDHRHLVMGEPKAWLKDKAPAEFKAFLEAGFTTVWSMGDDNQAILAARAQLASGAMLGPRLYAARIVPVAKGFGEPATPPPPQGNWRDPGRTDPARPPYRPVKAPEGFSDDQIRAMAQQTKEMGFDALKVILVDAPGGPQGHGLAVLAAEGHKLGLRTFVHATHYFDTLTAVNSGIDVLAHTPHIGQLEENPAALQRIADAHIPMVSTLQVFIPHFDDTNQPLYRDGGPFPMPRPLSSAGQGPVNARLLWDKGVTYAYGTDTQWDPKVSLKDELRGLSLVFSPRDILKIMGPNSAVVAGRAGDLGTLDPGKLADLVLVDGDPLQDIYALTHVVMVLKEGKVVVDHTR